MRAGNLRHVVTIQSKTVTQDSYNEEIITWPDVATVRAAIETQTGAEYLDVESQGASISHKVTIRYYPDLAPTMIVVWGSRTFEIEAVLNDNLQRETVLMCNEVIAT
jgi:SPP1 family predicted phage head-tail adaptor